jgi:hypothetical protein
LVEGAFSVLSSRGTPSEEEDSVGETSSLSSLLLTEDEDEWFKGDGTAGAQEDLLLLESCANDRLPGSGALELLRGSVEFEVSSTIEVDKFD